MSIMGTVKGLSSMWSQAQAWLRFARSNQTGQIHHRVRDHATVTICPFLMVGPWALLGALGGVLVVVSA